MKIIGKIAQKTRISHARQLKYGVIILKKSSIKAKIHFLFFLIFFGVWTFSKDFKGFYGKIVKKKAQKSEISCQKREIIPKIASMMGKNGEKIIGFFLKKLIWLENEKVTSVI